jgi:hypothetical protein
MQQATDGIAFPPGDRNDYHDAIVSDVVSLIERVRASMRLIEAAIASGASRGHEEIAGNVAVLDDVTPRFVQANAALIACSAGLGAALRLLLEARTANAAVDNPAERLNRTVRSIGRA